MANRTLSEDTKITIGSTPTAGAAAVTAINGTTLNMAGWDGVLVIVTVGTVVSGAVTSIKMQQDSASGMGTAADLLGTNQDIGDTDDDKTFYIDLKRPAKQYVRVVVTRGTQNATIGGITYLQYRKRSHGTASHGSNVAGEVFEGPIEGTA